MTQLTPYTPVTLVTALAATNDISDDDYRDIYARLAQGRSLRNIELALHSGVTYGWWAKYAAGEKPLDRDRKNELRRWARENGGPDLPDLPPTPAEAVAARVHPDAAVYHVGETIASRVVLIAADITAIDIHINSNCAVLAPPQKSHQPQCNGRYTRPPTKAIRVSPATWDRLVAAKTAAGQTWDQYLAALLP